MALGSGETHILLGYDGLVNGRGRAKMKNHHKAVNLSTGNTLVEADGPQGSLKTFGHRANVWKPLKRAGTFLANDVAEVLLERAAIPP